MSSIIKPEKIQKNGKTYDLHVMWAIHHKCNFKCSYCPSELHDGETSHLKLDLLKAFIDKLYNHYKVKLGYENILFSFTGGEPTLWRDFTKFLSYAAQYGIRFGITTNASVGLNFWQSVAPYFDYICMSYHPENTNDEKFLSTFEYLHNSSEIVVPSIRFMMHPSDHLWNKCVNVMKKVRNFPNWTYECVHILDNYSSSPVKIDYASQEKFEFLKNNSFQSNFSDNKYVKLPSVAFQYIVFYSDGKSEKLDENKLINHNLVDFYGWECAIGLEQLLVTPTSDIFRAGCKTGIQNYVGNALEAEQIKFPEKGIICNTTGGCYCPTDIRISKSKIS